MRPAALPENEKRRLEKLQQYRILDTAPEDAFDRITRIVAKTIGVPIALVSLVDRDRQWFKSRHGLDALETPRELAFCAHAILGDKVFVIEDASLDDRFADNPLVAHDPAIRFYAGAPLKTVDGLNIGTLCAIDRQPHKLSDDHRQLLEDLAHLVVDEMELRIALQRAMDEAAEENRLRLAHDEFLATVSHELRTPLTSIRGTLGLLQNQVLGTLPDAAVKMLEIANRNTDNLINLINDLLDVQKLTSGNLHFDFGVVDCHDLITTTVQDVEGYAEQRGVTLVLHAEPVSSIVGDPARLSQALKNLISNAVKASTRNDEVTITLAKRDDAIHFSIQDKGCGIPKKFRPYVFDRFAQAESANKAKGTGLGLAITKAIVEAHNGTVEFESEEGAGTTFHIIIPIRRTLTTG